MDDKLIVELYWRKDSGAISATSQKYGAYCYTIADNILHSHEDSQECVNDTWLRAWDSIPPQRPSVLRLFLAKITRSIAFNRYNARNAEKRGGGEITAVLDELSECVAASSEVHAEYEAKELSRCINRFVHSLPERDGNVFLRRYFFNDSVSDIAVRYGLSENNVMVILSRTRKKLKKLLTEEGYISE